MNNITSYIKLYEFINDEYIAYDHSLSTYTSVQFWAWRFLEEIIIAFLKELKPEQRKIFRIAIKNDEKDLDVSIFREDDKALALFCIKHKTQILNRIKKLDKVKENFVNDFCMQCEKIIPLENQPKEAEDYFYFCENCHPLLWDKELRNEK